MALTTTAAASAGSRIVVVAANWNTAVVPSSATDSAGNTYTRHAVVSNGPERLAIFSAHAAAGLASGSPITVTFSGSTAYCRVMAVSFTGVAVTNAVDKVNTAAPAGTGTAWNTGPVSTTFAETLLFGAAGAAGNRTSTPGAGWTEIHDISGAAADEGTTTVYRTAASTGTFEATGTWSAAVARTGAIVALKSSAGGFAGLDGGSIFSAVRAIQLEARKSSQRAAASAYRRRHAGLVAFYPRALSATRVAAHRSAGLGS
jgi:hypothetical protein